MKKTLTKLKQELVFHYSCIDTDDGGCAKMLLLDHCQNDDKVCLEIRSWTNNEIHPKWMDTFSSKKVKVTLEVVDSES